MRRSILLILLCGVLPSLHAMEPGVRVGLGVGIDYVVGESGYGGDNQANGTVVTVKYLNDIREGGMGFGVNLSEYKHGGAPTLRYQTFDFMYISRVSFSADYFILSFGSVEDDPSGATPKSKSDVFGIGYGGASGQFFLDIRYNRFLDDGALDSTLQLGLGILF